MGVDRKRTLAGAPKLTKEELDLILRGKMSKMPGGGGRRKRPPGQMNAMERLFADRLHLEVCTGRVLHWGFEAITLRLADRTTYTPDFYTFDAGFSLTFWETKGHMEDDAAVKLKVAAAQFPWARFWAVKRVAGAWETRPVRSRPLQADAPEPPAYDLPWIVTAISGDEPEILCRHHVTPETMAPQDQQTIAAEILHIQQWLASVSDLEAAAAILGMTPEKLRADLLALGCFDPPMETEEGGDSVE
jgi:hypothetical protein